MVKLIRLDVPGLGNRTYVAVGAGTAVVIDPPRELAEIEDVVERRGARIGLVLETHRHADYVSGGLALSRRHGASYVVPAGPPEPAFSFLAARDGRRFEEPGVGVRVMATPGHTPHHVAYVLEDESGPVAVATGGSLLHGAVGRTDLHGPERTVELAQAQWASARRLRDELPGETLVLPTHGFGSLCSAGSTPTGERRTLADEAADNPVLTRAAAPFVAGLVASYGAIPRHYSRLPVVNALGPASLPDLPHPPLLSPDALTRLVASGHWIVDVRPRQEFAAAHLAGSVNVEAGGPLAAYLPWLLPAGAGVALVGDPATVDHALRLCRMVGIDSPLGIADGPARWGRGAELRSYPVRGLDAFAAGARPDDVVLLDVRSRQEWVEGHVLGAHSLPLPALAESLDAGDVPGEIDGREVWVYCAAGFRAAIAASLLDAAGVPVTLVDAGLEDARDAGVLTREPVRT